MDKIYAGVDPGEYGCIAFYSPTGKWVETLDLKVAKGYKAKATGHASAGDLALALKTLCLTRGGPLITLVETPHSLPSDGHVGAFTFGKKCGLIEGLLAGIGIHFVGTVPSVWKPQLGLNSEKTKSIALAIKFCTDLSLDVVGGLEIFQKPRAHADGRAEAFLLAYMAAHKLGGDL